MKYILLLYAIISLPVAVYYTICYTREYGRKWHHPYNLLALLIFFSLWWMFIKMTPENEIRLTMLVFGFAAGVFATIAVLFGSAVQL